MYKLYWSKMSGAIAPQVLLEEVGAKYEKIVVDLDQEENQEPDFLAINPMGQIPALVLPDGTLMTESAAIILQICDRHPEAKLAPPVQGGPHHHRPAGRSNRGLFGVPGAAPNRARLRRAL